MKGIILKSNIKNYNCNCNCKYGIPAFTKSNSKKSNSIFQPPLFLKWKLKIQIVISCIIELGGYINNKIIIINKSEINKFIKNHFEKLSIKSKPTGKSIDKILKKLIESQRKKLNGSSGSGNGSNKGIGGYSDVKINIGNKVFNYSIINPYYIDSGISYLPYISKDQIEINKFFKEFELYMPSNLFTSLNNNLVFNYLDTDKLIETFDNNQFIFNNTTDGNHF